MTDAVSRTREGTLAPPSILAEIESDASAAVAASFVELAAE